jgi:hypothetical protein
MGSTPPVVMCWGFMWVAPGIGISGLPSGCVVCACPIGAWWVQMPERPNPVPGAGEHQMSCHGHCATVCITLSRWPLPGRLGWPGLAI